MSRHSSIEFNEHDRQAMILAMMGFSCSFVETRTGLNGARVLYRLRKLGLNSVRTDYRNGKGQLASFILARGAAIGKSNVTRQITRWRDKT